MKYMFLLFHEDIASDYSPEALAPWNKFAEDAAKVATFTLDRLAFSLNPPTVNVVVDFEGGGRFLCEMTDCEAEKVSIGDEVEPTFRRMYTAGGVHNYFWKVRPKR